MPKLSIGNRTKHYAYTPAGLAAYKRDKNKHSIGDEAEKKRQSAMVMDADLKDQSRGVIQFLNDRYGSKLDHYAPQYESAKMFADVIIGDIIGEGAIRDMFPSEVWEPATEKWLTKIWEKENKLANKGAGGRRPKYIPENEIAERRQGSKK